MLNRFNHNSTISDWINVELEYTKSWEDYIQRKKKEAKKSKKEKRHRPPENQSFSKKLKSSEIISVTSDDE